MIRQILSFLIKPKKPFTRTSNKLSFSSNQKVNQQKIEKDTISQEPSIQKQSKSQKDDQQGIQQEYVYEKQNRWTRGWIIYRAFFWGTFTVFGYNLYLVVKHKKKTPVEQQSFAVPYVIDAAKWVNNQYRQKLQFFKKPPVQKLLPDPIHPIMQPKTLVLNLSGTLVKTDFVFGKGMVMKRRPGLNNFLKKLSQKYELVIFTDDDYMFLNSVTEILDPTHQIFLGAFGKQCMAWQDNGYVKDLTYLNRDLKNIIVIDRDTKSLGKFKQNAIVLKEFEGDENDQELIKLLPLLESLSQQKIRDVRKQLSKLGQNPHQKFYQHMLERKKNIQKKKNIFMRFLSGITNKNKQN